MIAYIEEYNLSQDKNNIIKQSQLYWSDQLEAHSNQFDSAHFNKDKAINISQYVFCDGNFLLKRWKSFSSPLFCIVEIGFERAINFINTAQHFLNFQKKHPDARLQRLHYISFEQTPLSIEELTHILQQFPQFADVIKPLIAQYPIKLIGCHRLSFNDGQIVLDLWFGDTNQQLNNINGCNDGIADAWFLNTLHLSEEATKEHQTFCDNLSKHSKKQATLSALTTSSLVKNTLIKSGFQVRIDKGYQQQSDILLGELRTLPATEQTKQDLSAPLHQANTSIKDAAIKDVAIIGGGISALCTALSLAKRGNKVTIYTKDNHLGTGASGNLQGALYPLLNQQHDELGQLFANAYLYALNFYKEIDHQYPFAHEFNGVIQLAYDPSSTKKLQKINDANLPEQLLHWITPEITNQLAGVSIDHPALFYPTGGWLSPREVITSLHKKLNEFSNVTIHYHHQINTFSEQPSLHEQQPESTEWLLQAAVTNTLDSTNQLKEYTHNTLVIAAGFDTLTFDQCRAVPLSAARGQVSHIKTNPTLSSLKRTLCHEGYLTPSIQGEHCMGATFKRHDQDIEYRASEQIDNHQKLKKCIANKPWVDSITVNEQAHVGVRCTTRDHFPYVGALTDYNQLKQNYELASSTNKNLTVLSGVYLLTGLGSRGLCSAPLLGELLASDINNESLPLDKNIVKRMQIPRQWINYMLKNKALKD